MAEFEVGKWYPTRNGGPPRYVIGKSPDGTFLFTCLEGGSEIVTYTLGGRFMPDFEGPKDLIQWPRKFEKEAEVVAIENYNGTINTYVGLAGTNWCGKVIARKVLKVKLTEGEGV